MSIRSGVADRLWFAALVVVVVGAAGRPNRSQTHSSPPDIDRAPPAGACPSGGATAEPQAGDWNGWGRGPANSRYQPQPGLTPGDVRRLKVKWAFAYDGKNPRGQPTVVGGRVYVANAGRVYALNAKTGCTYWTYASEGGVRTAISIGRLPRESPAESAAYFGDDRAVVHAVDARAGTLLWKTKIEDARGALITGSPTLYNNRLYVPVSSNEEGLASWIKNYECCKFRGSIVALDAATGAVVWKTYTIAEAPKPFKKSADGVELYGPAGASVWSAPTIDVDRRLLYVGTGNSYTDVPTSASDAILAIEIDSGRIAWISQQTSHDNYVMNCPTPGVRNCPEVLGEDFDFGSSPILHTLPTGRTVILAGQKSGALYALDPNRGGALLWKIRLTSGGFLGGIEWGPAADRDNVYVAISDVTARDGAPGLYAVAVATGERIWTTPAPTPACSWGVAGCSHAQSQAVTVIPGIAFSGSIDGHLRAYSTNDGAVVWDFDTARAYDTVTGGQANGGSLDAGGPAVVDGVLYVNSGYSLIAGRSGNVLLAFSVDGK